MNTLQIAIVIVFLLLCFASILLYYVQQKNAAQTHLQHMQLCAEGISTNKQQIQRRQNCLKNYDFLKQNISEALCIQQEIDISC